ncbi:hypothetical protein KR038_011509 [Drosophila bunnanda]|nr:hypothetical protein KR038_011509 [Drosophila bunnanda]
MSKAISGQRLVVEWKNWNSSQDRRVGIQAEPWKNPNGTLIMRLWNSRDRGPKSTPWERGIYQLLIPFPDEFPEMPPKCRFVPPLYHPNISSSGVISIPDLNREMCWSSTLTNGKILLRIQDMLSTPQILEGINKEAVNTYVINFNEYLRKAPSSAKAVAFEDDDTD